MTNEELQELVGRWRADIVVGIDPDVEKNGMAVLSRVRRELHVSALPFPELIQELVELREECAKKGLSLRVYVEAGWLNRSNWHLPRGVTVQKAAAMGESVGRNQEVGHLIVAMCRWHDIGVMEVKPLRKMWRGKDGKITTEELELVLEQCGVVWQKKRINQEVRDAVLLALQKI